MTRRQGLIGIDFAETCRTVGEQLQADYDANFQRRENMRADAERKAQSIASCPSYRVKVERVYGGWQATTLEHPPFVGKLSAVGHSYDSAIVELRMAYAAALHKAKLIPNWDDCRRHAGRAQWVREVDIMAGV